MWPRVPSARMGVDGRARLSTSLSRSARSVLAAGRGVYRRRWWVAGGALLCFVVLELAFVGGALTERGCSVCHAPARAGEHVPPGHSAVGCLDCHREAGPVGWVRLNVRAAENASTWLLRRDGGLPLSAPPPEQRCRACHEETLAQVVSTGAVRMRHSDVSAEPCGLCHDSHPSPVSTSGLVDPHRSCRTCHDGTRARSDCATCHLGEPGPAGGGGEGGTPAHPAGWEADHGLGALSTCSDCHAPTDCAECHGVSLPHDPSTFLYTHGEQAVSAGEKACEGCHEREVCDACHTVPVPHPDDFLPAHSSVAGSLGGEACGTCHLRTGCDRCHLAHIHPGLPEEQLQELRRSLEGAG